MPAKKQAKKKPGPAPKPAHERARIVSTSVRAVVADWLAELGGGKLTAGMRQVLDDAYESRGKKKIENLS